MDKIRINLYDLLLCVSNAQDLMSPVLANHHQQVAYLAFRLAEQMKLPIDKQKDIFLAALAHDIGALSMHERLEIIETEPITVSNHAFQGAKLLAGFKLMQNSCDIIKFHHLPWNYGEGRSYKGEIVPLGSHIVHLADRTCAMIGAGRNVITQLPDILSAVNEKKGSIFEPELVDKLFELSTKEYIWLDLTSPSPLKMIPDVGLFNILVLEIDDIIDLSLIFSQIIDFRSSFTARHSAGVAKTAERLAQLVGFSPYECKMMLIAGYLHDLGKIAISNEVLEKPGKLNEQELHEMRIHTYHTYHLLDPIAQLNTIKTWASYHHERINGFGYPFHIKGDNLSLGARVVAVADVFTAISENRPYRKGMADDGVKQVLSNMVKSEALDRQVVGTLIANFQEINDLRKYAQQEASKRYKDFMLPGGSLV